MKLYIPQEKPTVCHVVPVNFGHQLVHVTFKIREKFVFSKESKGE